MSFEKPTFENNDSKIEELKGLILTSEGYMKTPYAMNAEKGDPYTFNLSNKEKELIFFGSPHINDPESPIFDSIKEKIEETKPDIVYVEGIPSIDRIKEEIGSLTLDEAKKQGESIFSLKLAIENNINVESPEPDFSKELEYQTNQGFSKKDIFNYYMYRIINQYQHNNENTNVEECKNILKQRFERFRKQSNWDEKELEIMEKEIIDQLDIKDNKYSNETDPIPWEGKPQTVINEVSRSSSNFRDKHIFEEIAKGKEKYNKLFVVYGSGHAVSQEPALKALFEKEI
ncbi:hypothetical protein KBB74_02145 [Candidatus Parcubacteria bacterium]|nr:hypothetical protein [Candidatus Parcubacteria bacterium]